MRCKYLTIDLFSAVPLMLNCYLKFSFTSKPGIRSFQMLRVKYIAADPLIAPRTIREGELLPGQVRNLSDVLLSTA